MPGWHEPRNRMSQRQGEALEGYTPLSSAGFAGAIFTGGGLGRGAKPPSQRLEEAVLLQPAVDRPPGETEGLGGALLVVLVDLEGPEDQILLHLGQRG